MNTEYSITDWITRCPMDPALFDLYTITITSDRTIKAEDILGALEGFRGRAIFQEDFTLALARVIRASVKTVGFHSGIKTVCTSP